jgi:hypothetical protein
MGSQNYIFVISAAIGGWRFNRRLLALEGQGLSRIKGRSTDKVRETLGVGMLSEDGVTFFTERRRAPVTIGPAIARQRVSGPVVGPEKLFGFSGTGNGDASHDEYDQNRSEH